MSDGSNGALRPVPASGNGRGSGNGFKQAPAAASQRRYLRSGLPGVYLDGDFGMRFVGGMEVVLDPIVATIESLPALFDAELAPEHLLTLLSSWLGLSTDEQLGPGVRRELVRNAAELTRLRGTAAGLQLLLHITFPEAGLVVEDGGGVQVDEGVPTPPAATSRSFKVRSRTALDDERRAAVIRAIERERPVHVSYELVEPTRRPAARAGGPR